MQSGACSSPQPRLVVAFYQYVNCDSPPILSAPELRKGSGSLTPQLLTADGTPGGVRQKVNHTGNNRSRVFAIGDTALITDVSPKNIE